MNNDRATAMLNRGILCVTAMACVALMSGCATTMRKPAAAPQPTTAKLSTFPTVTMTEVSFAPECAKAGANEKARKKINELLAAKMKMVFPNFAMATGEAKADASKPALRIEPRIEDIKFVGGAARFWVGAMAGSSAVLMKVTFVNAANGQVLGSPEFYQSANAMGGAWSMGGTDNAMLDAIAQDIVMYIKLNM